MLLLSVLPSIVLFFVVWKQDRIEKEPAKLLWKLFLFGLLTTVSASIIEIVAGDIILGFMNHNGMLYLIIDNFLIVALSEEAGKYIVLKKITWRNPAFNYTFDALVYSVTVSLGFATLENILYLLENDFSIAIVRALFSVPGHVFFAIFMGYYYGLAKHADAYGDERLSKKYLRKAFWIPVLLHGFFDLCLSTEYGLFLLLFFIFDALLTTFAFIKLFKQSRIAAAIPEPENHTDNNTVA